MKQIFSILLTLFSFVLLTSLYPQSYHGLNPDTVKAKKFDMGRMWTFEDPPIDYFEETYDFTPDEQWLDKVQKSALKFRNGCSASFVSEDGLIMTNHHCIRSILHTLDSEGEDLLKNGFYAETLEDERPFPDVFVNQLMLIEDVTEEITTAMEMGKTDSAKIALRDEKINEIKEKNILKNPELNYRVVSLYYGGRYSLYGYKTYRDVRLVFVPELQVSKLGGDYDNFTYPRYGLDCAFLRAYDDDGNPIKTDYYFNFSSEPIYENQLVFVVGNPGSTNRIYTIAQLEFIRDYKYGLQTPMRSELYSAYEQMVEQTEAEDTKLVAKLYSVGNGLKVYSETYKALLNPEFIARKKDFENKFKDAVQSDPELNKKYGDIWDKIKMNRDEASTFAKEMYGFTINSYFAPEYLLIAQKLVKLANQLNLNDEEREEKFKDENVDEYIKNILPDDINVDLEYKKLIVQINVIQQNLSSENELIRKLFEDKNGKEAADHFLSKSILTTKEDVIELAKKGADAILNLDDPFIKFVLASKKKLAELEDLNKKLDENDQVNNQLLGEVLYKVYGDEIPPDATGTLRISDGVIKGYDYNGTRAPYKTTFYGSLDRYYSFNKKFPFNLPEYWENMPKEFDLSTSLNFVSTNDIIGGNSGSPVINSEAEVVGLAFDGNIESHSGRFIFTTEANRTLNVSVEGMIEAIRDLYKAKRLSVEILSGKLE